MFLGLIFLRICCYFHLKKISMNSFDNRAQQWDTDSRIKFAGIVVEAIKERCPLSDSVSFLEYGCGTGLIGLGLHPLVGESTFMDSSQGMLEVLEQKVSNAGLKNITVLRKDILEDREYASKFDLVVTSLVLHHIPKTKDILERFGQLLNTGGRLAIIDLATEDGSFHGAGFDGHNGFDIGELSLLLTSVGYKVTHGEVFIDMKKEDRKYPTFIIVGEKL